MKRNNVANLDTFYILDLDRTLYDTAGASQVLLRLIAEHDPELSKEIESKLKEYEKFGISFSIRDAIVDHSGEAAAVAIGDKLTEYGATHSLLRPGATELLEFALSAPQSEAGILTFGSQAGQMMKIVAAKLQDIPVIVTDQKHKGALINSWRSGDGYQLPPEFGSFFAKEIVFVDDHIASFEGAGDDLVGYWLTSQSSVLDVIAVAERVTRVPDLHAVIAHETQRRRL